MLRLLSIPFRFWSFRAFSWLFLLLSLSAVISCPKSQGSMRDFRLFPKREHCVPCLHAEALGNQTWSAAMQMWLFPIFYRQLQGATPTTAPTMESWPEASWQQGTYDMLPVLPSWNSGLEKIGKVQRWVKIQMQNISVAVPGRFKGQDLARVSSEDFPQAPPFCGQMIHHRAGYCFAGNC